VDWAGHANQSARNIEEQLDFNAMVDSVIAWIEHNNAWDESLVIVTADHETGYLTGSTGGKLINKGKGKMPGMKWNSGDHTNQLVPFFAKGSGAEFLAVTADNYDPMRGYHTDNAKVGQVLQTIYREGKVPAERIDPSSSSAASSSSATSSSSSSTNSSSSTKPSSSSSGSVKPSSSSATTALNPATTLRTSSLQVQGKAVLVHIGQSGVARLVVNNVDGTRQAVLMNGYANAGFYRFALPVVQGASALVLETADSRKVLNISSMR
jgi:alkaline phosphatase